MPGYSMELYNVGTDNSSDTAMTKGGKAGQKPSGCHVSSLMGFVLVLLAVVLAVGVGLIVFLARSQDVTCSVDNAGAENGPPSISDAVTSCKDFIQDGGAASVDICDACPAKEAATTTTTTTTTTTRGPDTTPSVSTTTTVAPPYPRDKYRLPTNVKPYHYTLRMQPHIYGADASQFFFEGSVTIDVKCQEPTDVITLHVFNLTIDPSDVSVVVKGSGVSVGIRDTSYETEPQFYRIHLIGNLNKDVDYQITFSKFTGPLSRDGIGLYFSSYTDGEQTVYLATTQFEAFTARKAFPCFDEPAMRATFDTTLVRKTNTGRDYITLSNMDQLNTKPISGGWTEDVYRTTMTMSTYLLAFIVCDFRNVTDTILGIEYSTWGRPNAIQYARTAQDHGLKVFTYFESRFAPPYSGVINKLDNIAIPDFTAGAMENWGLITYRDALLFKPGVAAASVEDWIAEVIAHEVAHMWFGNMVSPKWWGWLWLNEGFAAFWDFHSVGEIYPTWRKTEIELNSLHSVMTSDALASSHPLSADVESRQEVSSIFDAVTYGKGGFVVRMMNFIMGQDKFIEALNIYLNDNSFGNAEHKDLWRALDEVGLTQSPPVNMTLKMDPWVTQMGYPVVMVTRAGGDRLRLSQQRFLLGSEDSTDDRYKDPPYDYKWEIPITYTSSSDTNFNVTRDDITWLTKDSPVEIADPTAGDTNGWFLVNVQQYGYFRVNYDQQNWDALITQLNTDHTVIHPINRAQIINDAWNLVKADLLDMETALRLVAYLSSEVDYAPWQAFAREMDYVELMLDRSDLYSHLEDFMRDAVSAPLRDLGLDISPDLPPVDVFARVLVATYACKYGHSACVNAARQQFDDWMGSGTNGIDPNLRYLFYCTALERGGVTEWNFVYGHFKKETDATENSRLRKALACTKEPSLLTRLLAMTMEADGIRTQDARGTILDVSGNRWGRSIAFNFVVQHFAALVDIISDSHLNGIITTITASFNSDYDLVLLGLLEESAATFSFGPALAGAREQINTNKDWLHKHQDSLENWLRPQGEDTGRLNYRLPGGLLPTHYAVRLQPHIYGNDSSLFSFDGSCTIVVRCTAATSTVTLHMVRLDIDSSGISVIMENSAKELFQSMSYEETRHFLHLHLTDPLEKDKTYHLLFAHFSGTLTPDGIGFYLSNYREGEETVYTAMTQMAPSYARKTFPCFDEPALKARFDITLVRRNDTDRDYISLSNAALLDTAVVAGSPAGESWVEDRFETTPTMSTYLLAFIVCDFPFLENTTTSSPQIPYRTYARREAIQWADRAHEFGLKAYDWMDRNFQPPYGEHMNKLDGVAVSDINYGAMENWGLIVYREAILYQPGVTSAASEFWMGLIITHEIAHMWYGDYVSPKWWDYVWLNEAFATWWDAYVIEQIYPEWRAQADMDGTSPCGSSGQSADTDTRSSTETPVTRGAFPGKQTACLLARPSETSTKRSLLKAIARKKMAWNFQRVFSAVYLTVDDRRLQQGTS